MQSERTDSAPVKGGFQKKRRKFRGRRGDRRTRNLNFRLHRYLIGTFSRGLQFKFAAELKESFRGTTKFSARHVDRAFANFRGWTSEWKFEEWRVGRSTQIVITPAGGVERGVPIREIAKRLRGAINRYLEIAGTAKIDAAFLRKFCEITALPESSVEIAWHGLRKFAGHVCRWRGVGGGRKLVITKTKNSSSSPRQTSEGFSSPSERKEPNQRPAFADRTSPQRIERRPVAAPDEEGWGAEVHRAITAPDPGIAENSPEASSLTPSDSPLKSKGNAMQVCGRWLGKKLKRPAALLAFVVFPKAHAGCERVQFVPGYAWGFAFRSIRAGFRFDAIAAAYAAGVRRSHEDALDKDRLPGGGYAFQRLPSSAVCYAAAILHRADPRGTEARWADFFATPKKGKAGPKVSRGGNFAARVSKKKDAAPAPETALPAARFTPAEARERLAELRARIAPPERAPAPEAAPEFTLGELSAYLREIGLSMANFSALPYSARMSYIAKIVAARKK